MQRAAWVLALLAHALIIWALLHIPASLPRPAALERITVLYLPPPEHVAPAASEPSTAQRRSRIRSAQMPGPPTVAAPTAAAPQAESLPPIDWAAEQDRVAESKGRENWKQLSQHCRDAEALHIYPPECHRYVAPEPWQPGAPSRTTAATEPRPRHASGCNEQPRSSRACRIQNSVY